MRAAVHEGEEQVGEQEGAHVVHLYRALQPIDGIVVAGLHRAGIVHQEVEVGEAAPHLEGKAAHEREVGQVDSHHFDVGVARLGSEFLTLGQRPLGAVAGHDDVVACLGHRPCLFVSHAAVGTGDNG